MDHVTIPMPATKRIALIAHDSKKADLLAWVRFNRDLLARHRLFATGTTGRLLEQELGLEVFRFRSGPLGGDQQIGAKIVEHEIDLVIFFWDPLEAAAARHRTSRRCCASRWSGTSRSRATAPRADFIISSPLMVEEYDRILPDYGSFEERPLDDPTGPDAVA